MFPSLNVLTKLLFGFLKESGFVRFAHSILFNFQVPHIRYRVRFASLSRWQLIYFTTAFSFCQEVFENFFSEVFEAHGASTLPGRFSLSTCQKLKLGFVSGGITLSRGDFHILAPDAENVNPFCRDLANHAKKPGKTSRFSLIFSESAFIFGAAGGIPAGKRRYGA